MKVIDSSRVRKANGLKESLKASLPWPLKDDRVEDMGLGTSLSAWKWPKRWEEVGRLLDREKVKIEKRRRS